MFQRRCWQQATDKLADLGVEIVFVTQQQAAEQSPTTPKERDFLNFGTNNGQMKSGTRIMKLEL